MRCLLIINDSDFFFSFLESISIPVKQGWEVNSVIFQIPSSIAGSSDFREIELFWFWSNSPYLPYIPKKLSIINFIRIYFENLIPLLEMQGDILSVTKQDS